MPVIIDGKKIIPAPFVSISNEAERSPNSQKKRDVFTITLTGSLVADKGSPSSTGVFYTLSGYPAHENITADSRQTAIQGKIGALTELLNTENRWCEISGWDGQPPIKFLFRKRSVTYEEGVWYNVCRYSIVLEAECIYFGDREVCAFGSVDELTQETWDIEPAEENQRTFRLTHTVSAQFPDGRDATGALTDKGYIRAKNAVIAKLGINNAHILQSGVLNLTDFNGYNHSRTVNEGVSDGSYRVTENWLCADIEVGEPACIEDYTLTIRENNGILSSSIEGTINGLFIRDADFAITTTKLANAQAKWALVQPVLFDRCQSATERVLNPSPVGRQKAQNITQGIITYAYEYNTRSDFGLTGAKQVNVTVQDVKPHDVFAAITVINRIRGPILQSIGTVTERRRTINVDVIMNPVDYGAIIPPTPVDVSSIIIYYTPSGYSQYFLAEDNETYALSEGRYARIVSYVYQ